MKRPFTASSKPAARRLAVVAVLLGGLGVAAAQPASEAPEATPADPNQMVSEAEGFLPQMEQSGRVVRRQLASAREDRDVVKVLCLNDKLNQIDVALRTTQDRVASLRGAAARGDKERSRHEHAVLKVLRDRVRALVSEANQCIGEDVGFAGESKVTANIDPNIPDIDATDIPGIDSVVSPPPVVSSPIK